MPLDLVNDHPTLRVHKARLAQHGRRVLRHLQRSAARVDLTLTDDETIRGLNRDYRGMDAVTDVLSFAIADDPEDPGVIDHLGDIVISLDTASRQAAQMTASVDTQWTLELETTFLLTHGLLHLLGFDHVHDDEAQQMETLERTLMKALSPVDPHALDRDLHGLDDNGAR